MTVVDGASLMTVVIMALGVAILLAVAANYVLRPRTRKEFQGGTGRYLAALFVQAAAFMTPIPLVWFLLIGRPIPPGLDVLIGVMLGVALVIALRFAPFTGPLLKELARARLEVAHARVSQ